MTLTPLEQKVYHALYEQEVFRSRDVEPVLKNYWTSVAIIRRLHKKGYVERIRRGLYAIVPIQSVGKEYAPERILIADRVIEPYFLSHHTALEVHGVAQSYFNTVFVSSKKRFQPFEYKGTKFTCIVTGDFFGTEKRLYLHRKVYVSDPERTILDCIRRPYHAGGLEELIKSITSFPLLDYNRLYKYLLRFDEKSLFHRTGYLMDMLKDDLRVPERFLDKVRKKLSQRTYYLETGKRGVYVKKWNIIVPKNIKEVMRFV